MLRYISDCVVLQKASVVSPPPISFTQALLAAARHPNQETFRRCVDAIAAVPEAQTSGKPFGVLRGQTLEDSVTT